MLRSNEDMELKVYQVGSQHCKSGHSWGPAIRDYFLIHYVHAGKGIFQVGNEIFTLTKGQGFLICPNVVSYYKADIDEPWHYSWVGFNGLKAEEYLKYADMSVKHPIFNYNHDDYLTMCINQMVANDKPERDCQIRLTGLVYLFLSQLVAASGKKFDSDSEKSIKEIYVKKAVEYIQINYSSFLSVEKIASYIGLERSYFGVMFKKHTGVSPKTFITNYRISKSVELIKNSQLPISYIARSVGYEDQLLFSKVFRRIKEVSPSEFRKLEQT